MIRNRVKLIEYLEILRKTIESRAFLDNARFRPQDFTRNRKMPFQLLVFFLLSRRKRSTQNELENFFEKMGIKQEMSQQGVSDARYKIKDSAFSDLFYQTAALNYHGYYETWNGYRLLAIDGSKIALPDIALLGRYYGTMGADSSSPTAQASICYDVLNRFVVDALIEPLAIDERTLALEHIRNLDKSVRLPKELVLMDRGYPSFDLIHQLKKDNIAFVLRVKSGFNLDIDAQTQPDGQVALHKAGYPDIPVRIVKFPLPSGETETLVTSLEDPSLTTHDFKKLYFLRWPVETKFDEVKNKLEIENFTGYSILGIRQDFYATMLMANLAAAARWEAQDLADQEREGKNNKYEYQINVNHEIGVLKDRLIYAFTKPNPAAEVDKIIRLLAKRVCPVKPGRSPVRNGSPRKSKFHSNMRSNA